MIKLRRTGIKFKPRKGDGWLNIQFNNGVLEIPRLTIDELTSSFFLNRVAFERCYHNCSQHIISYVTFVECFIASVDDASFSLGHQVLENYHGVKRTIRRGSGSFLIHSATPYSRTSEEQPAYDVPVVSRST